eukprot:972207_1
MATNHDNTKQCHSRYMSIVAKSRMEPTTRSVLTEMTLFSLGVTFALVHAFIPTNLLIMYISGIPLIISGIVWFYFEVHKQALIYVMNSFRGFIITISVIIVPICDIFNKYVTQINQPISIILINNACWATAILILCGADCCPRNTNFSRFAGPVCVLMNAVHNIFLYSGEPEVVVLKYKFGEITIQQIEAIATIQLILFSASFIMGFPRDRNHEYFVILNNRIPKKNLVPHLNVATEMTNIFNLFEIQTKWLFITLTICAVLVVAFHWLGIGQLLIIIVFDCMAMVTVCVIICVLMYCYFHKRIIKLAMTQFRCNMLSLSVLIIIYVTIQERVWELKSQKIFFGVMISMGTFVLLIRDGLSITYPFYFTAFLASWLGLICIHNVFFITFIYDHSHLPLWFVWLEKEAFYQVIVVCGLILWNLLIGDRENRYFALIRERKRCKELFYDEDQLHMFDLINDDKL